MGWPQIIYLTLSAIGVGFVIAKHGQPQKPINATAHLIGTAVVLAILYWGGFFS